MVGYILSFILGIILSSFFYFLICYISKTNEEIKPLTFNSTKYKIKDIVTFIGKDQKIIKAGVIKRIIYDGWNILYEVSCENNVELIIDKDESKLNNWCSHYIVSNIEE